jgi:protein TonB
MMTIPARALIALGVVAATGCATAPKAPGPGFQSRLGFAWQWNDPPPASDIEASALVARFTHAEPDVRAEAAWRLPAAHPGPVELQALMGLLDDPAEKVRDEASLALFRAGHLPLDMTPLAPSAVPDTARTAVRLLKQPRPMYPEDAAQRRIHGTVAIYLLISATGRVLYARIEQSVPGLDDAALLNVRQWTFAPATKNGRAVPSIAYGEVKFRLL